MNEDFENRMNFIVEQQAQFWADLRALDERLASTAKIVENNSRQIDATREMIRQLVDVSMSLASHIQEVDDRLRGSIDGLKDRIDELTSAQSHSDRRLDALIDIVDKMIRRNGGAP